MSQVPIRNASAMHAMRHQSALTNTNAAHTLPAHEPLATTALNISDARIPPRQPISIRAANAKKVNAATP